MEIEQLQRIPFECNCAVAPNGKRIIFFSQSVITVLGKNYSAYKEISFKGILDAVTSEHFIYILRRDGSLYQYNIEDDEILDLDCPLLEGACLALNFDCSLLTVQGSDSAAIVNLLRMSTAIQVNHSRVYALREDYILLLNQRQNELCFQINDQNKYFEFLFPGQFEHICVDEVSLTAYAFEQNKNTLMCFDLRTPARVLIFNEMKLPFKCNLIFSADMEMIILHDRSNLSVSFLQPNNMEIENTDFKVENILSFQNCYLVTKTTLYRVNRKIGCIDPVFLQDVITKNSPISKLMGQSRRKSFSKPEVKNILFQSKVKSSGYGVQTKPRKMFQPVTKKENLKPKKTNIKVAEYNFSPPIGRIYLKNSSFLETTPTWIQPTPNGKFLISEGLSISTFDLDEHTNSKTVATEATPIVSFENSTDGYMAVGTASTISCWSSKDCLKPFARIQLGTEKIQNISNGLSFISKLKNEISFIKFEVGEKTELDRSGMGNGECVYSVMRQCNEISSFCCLPSQKSVSITESNGEIVIFDLNYGKDAAKNNNSTRRNHWMEQIDQHSFVTMAPNGTGAFLYDIRDFQRVQRRFPFGPNAHKCSGSISYDSKYLSYGNEAYFVIFDLSDTRPIVAERHSSPVYFTKFKSVSNHQICIDLDRNIFAYE